MNKRIILPTLLGLLAAGVGAQTKDVSTENIDWEEDTAKVVSITDILNMRQSISTMNDRQSHFAKVWGNRTFLNISYTNERLLPTEGIGIYTGVDEEKVEEFKSDWGISLKWGHNYQLHKRPIANIVSINMDFVWTDINVAHFKAKGNEDLYDSSSTFTKEDEQGNLNRHYYLPWNLEKYDFNYGMAVGPSITVAPFTTINSRGLHYIKLNFYYHIGYSASLLLMKNDKGKADKNTSESGELYRQHDLLKGSQLALGWGLIQSFGFNIGWNFVCVGYEYRKSMMKFQAIDTNRFSNRREDFKSMNSRFYLQFRF